MPVPFRPFLALLALLSLPASAEAVVVSVQGGALTIAAAPGEANRVALSAASGALVVADPGTATLGVGAGCSKLLDGRASCTSAGVTAIAADLGDADDTFVTALTLPVTLDAGAGADTIVAGPGADTLTGGPGADTLEGGAGNDVFADAGGAGADVLRGGTGYDRVSYASRTAPVTVVLDARADDGEAGEGDLVAGDVERVDGGSGPDRLTGNDLANSLRGGDGADVLAGWGGADDLDGGGGIDRVTYAEKTDGVTVDSDGVADDGTPGEGDDVGADVEDVTGGSGDDLLTGTGGGNTLEGGPGADTLRGQGGADTLRGGDGNDRLEGADGDDTLDGGLGDDVLEGGRGVDTADYAARTEGVVVTLGGRGGNGAPGEDDLVTDDVERLRGGPGPDVLTGAGGADTIYGGAGDDRLAGGGGADTLRGEEGDDVLDGGTGADDLGGGLGRDRVDYSGGGRRVTVDLDDASDDGEDGERDRVRTDVENIQGSPFDDRLTGNGEDNVLLGGGGEDVLKGVGGNDRLEGGADDDRLEGGGGGDVFLGGEGRDTVDYGLWTGTVRVTFDDLANDGSNEADDVRGDIEVVIGGSGDDELWGGAAPVELRGGDGDDLLRGGAGDDLLVGGDGRDGFAGGAGADRLEGGPGRDRLDGSGLDGPLLLALAAGSPDPGDTADSIEDVRGGAGADRLIGDGGENRLEGNGGDDRLDGGGGADVLDGGDGRDVADYSGRSGPVTADNDGEADDGEAGERDDVGRSVEGFLGGSGADTWTTATGAGVTVDGGAGGDTLRGGTGSDRIDGGAGADRIVGGAGADTIIGGDGADRLEGGPGLDAIDAGPGNDTIEAGDGVRETVRCGPGRDRVHADRADKLIDCEIRSSAGLPAIPAGPATPVVSDDRVAGVRTISGGGRFVGIPGFPGEKIDSRLLKDVAYIVRTYKIRVTDGYALSGHAAGGEHPIGLALDIVPGAGGTWDDIDRLARWAEPSPGRPRAPFRWVGYDGDANHGRGHHLHLSWNHAPGPAGKVSKWVQVLSLQGIARGGSLVALASRTNGRLGKKPSVRSGLVGVRRCSGAAPLRPIWKAAGKAFGIRWQVLAAITEIESGFGCNMGPSSAGAIGWTQFMPATWKAYGMDADGDGKASPYSSVDAVYSSARYLRASGAPRNYRKAIFAYNHANWYVRDVLNRAKKYR